MTGMPSDWLQHQAVVRPAASALITPAGTINYSALQARTRRTAADCLASGLVREKPVAVITDSREQLTLLAGAAFQLGCPLLPLSAQEPFMEQVLRDCGIVQAIADDALALPDDVIRFPVVAHSEHCTTAVPPRRTRAVNSVQLMMRTSGTTGQPKAVALDAKNIAASVRGSCERLGLAPGDVWLNCLPVTRIGGFAIFLRCMHAGAAMLLHETFDVARVGHALANRDVTHISLVPAMLAMLLDAGVAIPPASSLRVALIGGGPLDAELAARARENGWPLRISYGMTETASHVCINETAADDQAQGDVGTPISGAKITLVDDTGMPVQGPGRIRIEGPMVMVGYLHCGTVDHAGPRDGFITGDAGYLDDNGHLHVIGRVDDVLVSGGMNIQPGEIEQLMGDCPGIREVAVTATPDPVWGDRLVACVAGDISVDDVERWSREHLPGNLRPRLFRKFRALPRDPLGRIDRSRLRHWIQTLTVLAEGSSGGMPD